MPNPPRKSIAHDVTDVIAHDCESVNAESTKEVYQAALERHPETSVIYIISDNVRYYHCIWEQRYLSTLFEVCSSHSCI